MTILLLQHSLERAIQTTENNNIIWVADFANKSNYAQFCVIYLFLFSTFFGHSRAHNQEKITVSMQNWYSSLIMGGVWSAGWIENPTSRPDATHAERDEYQCRIDTVIFS